jgi:cytidylate kinase
MIYDYLPANTGIYLNKEPVININSIIQAQQSKYVICIDGLAGSGKSTLGKHLSRILNVAHISSGIFYRVYTYIISIHHLPFDHGTIDDITEHIDFEISNKEFSIIYKGSKVPMSELKNDVIDAALNRYSSDVYFRSAISKVLVKMVHSLDKSFILDLRGASPEYVTELEEANRPVIRILLVADTDIKAARRLAEYMNLKYSKDEYYKTQLHQDELLTSIKLKIIQRDNQDIESINKTGIGLIHDRSGIIDSSSITEEEVTQLALKFIQDELKITN